ncbi:MAG: histidine kinase [Acidimicrobiia bacterium]|nr:histidine kinase [Acidimicrobiia bacterium]
MGLLDRVRGLIRHNPVTADAVFAVTLLVIGIVEQDFVPLDDLSRFLALLGATFPLIFRRRTPFLATVALYASASILLLQGGVPAAAQVSSLLALYYLGTLHESRRAVTLQLLAVLPFLVTILTTMILDTQSQFTLIIVLALFTAITITASELSKARLATQTALEERADQLEAAQRDLLRLAREDERAAIARELHDIVAHNVSVMVLQAGAAKRVIGTHPELALEALDAIDVAGREALGEMRLVVGVLRPDKSQGLEPQPALNRLGALISRVEEAGVPVALTIDGEVSDLPLALELSAYRIIQECLTNTMQHGGPWVAAQVSLDYQRNSLGITVTDNGRNSPATGKGHTSGHGLFGIAERVAMFDGTFDAGPKPDGGFRVQVRLPVGNVR